jgi:hypothetical protein
MDLSKGKKNDDEESSDNRVLRGSLAPHELEELSAAVRRRRMEARQ